MILASSNEINDLISGDISKEINCENKNCLSGLLEKSSLLYNGAYCDLNLSSILCSIRREVPLGECKYPVTFFPE